MRRLPPPSGLRPLSPGRLPRVFRYFVAAFLVDAAVNLTLVGVPYKAIRLEATPLQLGLLPAVWSTVYILAALVMGRMADRVNRIRMARTGAATLALAVGLLALAPNLPGLMGGLAVNAMGLAMFWPSLQSSLSASDLPGNLGRNLGWFNLAWGSGKGLGFATGGLLLASRGFAFLCSLSAGLALLVALFLRPVPPPVPADPAAPAPEPGRWADHEPDPREAAVPESRREAFLVIAWIANGVAYGVNATLGYHYPKYLDSMGIGSAHFGLFLGLTYLSQTVMFAGLMRTRAWHYRRWPLILMHLGLAAILVLLPFLKTPSFQLMLAPLVGASLGLAYFSSIYYSLHAARQPGRNTGMHEAIIGAGVLVAPPLGGALALASGRLEAPYFLVAAASVLAIAAQELVARRGSFRYP